MYERVGYFDPKKWSLAVVLLCVIGISACSSSSDQPPVEDDPGAKPTTPGNLTFTVHSHEAELSWTSSTDDGLIIGYDIIRDGMPVKELLDATNFLDAMLEPASTYQYSVIAVDDDGNRSVPSSIELTTLEGPPLLPVISSSNHVELLRYVFDIYTGNAYRSDIMTLPNWSDPAYSGLPFVNLDLPEGPDSLVETSITCSNGGTAVFVPFYSGYDYYETGWDFTFNECQDEALILDCNLHREYLGGARSFHIVNSSGLSIDGQTRNVDYSGEVELFTGGRGAPYTEWYTTDVEFTMTDGVSSFSLTDANTSLRYVWPNFTAGMSGGFVIRSDATAGRIVHATMLEELNFHSDDFGDVVWNIDSGILELRADDGSKLVLQAGNEDEHSVTIEISDGEGTSESLNQPSSLWAENLILDFNPAVWWNSL